MNQKKTKIICTLSETRCSTDLIKELYENGMNVVRINTAHASVEAAGKIAENVRKVSDRIAILIDTKGPEIRLTSMVDGEDFSVSESDILYFYDGTDKESSRHALYTSSSTFVKDVPVGSRILLDDATIELKVTGKDDCRLKCEVLNGGYVRGRKSINIPNVSMSLPSLTDKDREFIRWAIGSDIDFIAHSFVRSKEDLAEIHEMLENAGSHMKIISKIENQQGVDNLEEILHHCYGIMIARGDLGVEIPAERIPLVQNEIVHKCRMFRKPVIIATQMLHSMIENPRPTRAEVTDVANAIFQRADAVMLSGETASGQYPVEAVATMTRIALEAEKSIDVTVDLNLTDVLKPIAATLARNLVEASMHLPVKAIIFDTWTGRTGRYLAEFRPKVPVYAMCYREFTMRESALTFGIFGYKLHRHETKEDMVNEALEILRKDGKLEKGDLVGFIGGSFNDELGASYMEFKYV